MQTIWQRGMSACMRIDFSIIVVPSRPWALMGRTLHKFLPIKSRKAHSEFRFESSEHMCTASDDGNVWRRCETNPFYRPESKIRQRAAISITSKTLSIRLHLLRCRLDALDVIGGMNSNRMTRYDAYQMGKEWAGIGFEFERCKSHDFIAHKHMNFNHRSSRSPRKLTAN